jgi:sugar (pentulose or hexulose) kinase
VSTETSINMNYNGRRVKIGVGIHDSSAALLPYVRSQRKPFALISTGTWSISLNPFGRGHLRSADLEQHCLNYMRIDGKPVQAARLHLGEEYKAQTAALARHFGEGEEHHRQIRFDFGCYQMVVEKYRPRFRFTHIDRPDNPPTTLIPEGGYDYAYHQLMVELVRVQVDSFRTAVGDTPIRKIFVDGGFSANEVYLKLLHHHFRDLKLRTTDASLGTALGAAICISDRTLDSKFLKKNYGLRKHQPFILRTEADP